MRARRCADWGWRSEGRDGRDPPGTRVRVSRGGTDADPAASASGAAPVLPPLPAEPPISFRPYVMGAESAFAAVETFEAVFGKSYAPFFGGGLQVAFHGKFYVEVGASRFQQTGSARFAQRGELPVSAFRSQRRSRRSRSRPATDSGRGACRAFDPTWAAGLGVVRLRGDVEFRRTGRGPDDPRYGPRRRGRRRVPRPP